MPTLINNSKQLQVEHHILLNKLAVESQQMVGNGIGKMIADVGHQAARGKRLFGLGVKFGLKGAPAGIEHGSKFINAGAAVGRAAKNTGRFASSHPKALIGGAAGTGALVGGAALSRKKRTTTNEEPMTTVLVSNSEQLRVEHQVLLNRLVAEQQPKQMVGNGIGSLLSRGAGAAKKFAQRAGNRISASSRSFRKGFGAGSGKFASEGASTAHAAGKLVGRGAKLAGVGAARASKFARTNPKTAVAGAALGGAAVGSMIPRKK